MARVNSILELVGNTPLVRLNSLTKHCYAEVFVKLESHNPLSSVKDRIGLAMIEAAEKEGKLKPGDTIVEATSGNTGIALAYIGAAKGYHVVLTMPETMSIERRRLLKAFGAELVLTPGAEGMNGAVQKAYEIIESREDTFMTRQFENFSNPLVHEQTTAEEIWKDTEGNIDIFVAGVGTGGTITGVSTALKKKNPHMKAVAVEPVQSPVLSGGKPGPHKIQGIGAGFIPKVMNVELLDEIVQVDAKDAGKISRRLAAEEGILCGISAGANVLTALQLAEKEETKGKVIVTIICDTGERYLSTWLFDEE